MATLYYSHADFLQHDTGPGHPECAERLRSIDKALQDPVFGKLLHKSPSLDEAVQLQQIALIHPQQHIDRVRQAIPEDGENYLDPDTVVSPGSWNAALRAVSAVCEAVDQVVAGLADNAFCAVRPPGHHAEPNHAMGFCLFNNIAIAAAYARQHHGLQRVAIVDFDVHHGNGTQAAFEKQADVLYISTHQMPHYPGTGYPNETGVGNIINIPLQAGTDGTEYRSKFNTIVLPALKKFQPEMLLLSAGFDAHRDDPLASIKLVEDDYHWLTERLLEIAADYCAGRVVSVLEGGYNLDALARSVAAHVSVLLQS